MRSGRMSAGDALYLDGSGAAVPSTAVPGPYRCRSSPQLILPLLILSVHPVEAVAEQRGNGDGEGIHIRVPDPAPGPIRGPGSRAPLPPLPLGEQRPKIGVPGERPCALAPPAQADGLDWIERVDRDEQERPDE